MLTRGLLFIAFIFTSALSAQTYVQTWAISGSGTTNSTVWQTATDAQNNVLAVGEFSGTIQFGSTILSSTGGTDVFIVKYNSSGTLQWARKAGSIYNDLGYGITTDPSGNCYITGSYATTAAFGNNIFCNSNTLFPYPLLFIACYDSTGVCQWAKGAQNACIVDASIFCEGADIHYDSISGTLLFTGRVNGVIPGNLADPAASCISFDNIPFYSWGPGFLNNGLFWGRITTSGTCLFLKEEQNNAMASEGQHITTDINGDVIVAVSYVNQFTYDNVVFSTQPDLDLRTAILKCDINGNTIWTRSIAANGFCLTEEIETDAAGNIYVCGWFNDTLLDDPAVAYPSFNISPDGFVEKLLPDGSPAWIRTLSGPGEDYVTGLAYVDSLDQMAFCGRYFVQATLGGIPVSNLGASDNLFVALYNQNGTLSLFQQPDNTLGSSRSEALCVDQDVNIYIGGRSSGQIIWGADTTFTASGENAVLLQLSNNKLVSLPDEMQTNNLIIYPNPFIDQFVVSGIDAPEEITLTDGAGRVVLSMSNPAAIQLVQTPDLSPGLYVLRVRYENGSLVNLRLMR
ncbi:MAG: T9SS type A sorting domain-containing protein [Bacteroidia bacterium]